MSKFKTVHGHAARRNGKPSPTYVSWEGMRRRVTPVHTQHHHYLHVSVCKRWDSFSNFLEDMGERPEGLSLDRIDSDGNYCPENCRWATKSQQSKNRRHYSRKASARYTYLGRTQTINAWARELGVRPTTLHRRIKRGWSVEKTLTTPIRSVRAS